MGQVEELYRRARAWVFDNRRALFWLATIALLLWLMVAVRELTALLLLSYVIALIIDPFISRFERRGFSRAFGILLLYVLVSGVFILLLLVVVPQLTAQWAVLSEQLPGYVEIALTKLQSGAESLGIKMPHDYRALASKAREYSSTLGSVGLEKLGRAALAALLSGYSFTLTLLNLILVPFFLFYIARDLRSFHAFFGQLLAPGTRKEISEVGGEIVKHIQAFFKGQLTVCAIMAGLYTAGLAIVGLQSALLVGLLTGFLNIIPYLGVGLGVVLATIITLVNMPSFSNLLFVWLVFVVVQALEGNLLTPKIVGEKLGIHPLGVMLSLIIGGNLLGLAGLIIAIPVAAAARVLFVHLHEQAVAE